MSGPPIFVVGSARSGTTLLYHSLLSSGDFAVYRTEPAAFDLLAPKFGSMSRPGNRKRLMEVWLRSYQFRLSGLDRGTLENRILRECRSYGDFLRIVMNELSQKQCVGRWAVWGPDNLLHITTIARDLPDALFVHMIRDGRDVALSLGKEGWIHPFPWDSNRALLVGALHWKWKLEQGRFYAQPIPSRYLEVRFENLVTRPQETLGTIGAFIGHDLNYATIAKTAIGTLSDPNSTFRHESTFSNPVGRWKNCLSPTDIASLESVIGDLLHELGYPLTSSLPVKRSFQVRAMQGLYPRYFGAVEWLRTHTPMGRFVSTARLRFDDEIESQDPRQENENQSGCFNA
jgi:Sulfotransferase family